ncbi:MAG TPA: class I SAM-dependent methyltransferase [Longimicrobiales bacterium]|nr:class I SAM-dependent methyltransferase [Longimicrobiales bacterium]
MESDYARGYRELYRRHWWWRAREELLVELIERTFAPRTDLRILDVGCGSGLFFDRLARFGTVVGVEPDRALAEAEPRHRDRIHAGELATFHADAPFDLVLMLDVLEHITDAADVLARALSLLRDDGRIIITVPAFRALWTHHDVLNRHVTRYSRPDLAALVRGAGGRIDSMRYFFHWTFPAKLAVRLLERVRGPAGPERIPSAPVNRALYRLSRLEQRLAGPLHLPFGTSLLAVVTRAATAAGNAAAAP